MFTDEDLKKAEVMAKTKAAHSATDTWIPLSEYWHKSYERIWREEYALLTTPPERKCCCCKCKCCK